MAADGSIIINTQLDDKQAQAQLNRLTKKIDSLNEKINTSQQQKMPLVAQAEKLGEALDSAKYKLDAMKTGGGFSKSQIAEQAETVRSLQSQWNTVQGQVERYDSVIIKSTNDMNRAKEEAGVLQQRLALSAKNTQDIASNAEISNQRIVSLSTELSSLKARQAELSKAGVGLGHTEYDSITSRIAEINSELSEYKRKLTNINSKTKQTVSLTERITNSFKNTNKTVGKLSNRIFGLAKRVFFFSVITTALRSVREWFVNVIKTNDDAVQAIARLKASFLTFAQPLVDIIIPAITTIAEVLTQIVTASANLMSKFFGTTLEDSKKAAESLYDEAKAIEETGEKAEEASKSMASFDEINQLTDNKKDKKKKDEEIEPDFSFDKTVDGILDKLTALVSAALLVIGIILVFSGANIPLGIGLIAIGAIGLASEIAANPSIILGMLEGTAGLITGVLSTAFIVIGSILAFSGVNLPLGIALIAMGAIGLVASVAANWSALSQLLQGPIGVITALISSALLVIGAILTFSSANMPLGIGLMIVGAMGLAASVVANWGAVAELLQGPLGVIFAMLSAALLVIGAILTFSTANIPLGIGLMVIGAAGLAATVIANWDAIVELLRGPLGIIVAILSTALLVIGAILTFTGANIPLGIGLMVVGAIGLATTMAVNWDTISTILQGEVGILIGILSAALLVIGAILAFSNANLPLGIGLMVVGAIGLATTIAANWDTISTILQGEVGILIGILSAALLVIGAILAFSTANIPLGIGLMVAGAAGLATVAVANWGYIVEALRGPIGSITAIAMSSLLAIGLILCASGVGIPLGAALIAVGAAGLVAVGAANWGHLPEKVRDMCDQIKNIFSGLPGWFNENVTTPLLNFFSPAIERIGKMFEGVWIIIQAVWKGASTWFTENVINPSLDVFASLWDGVTSIWSKSGEWFDENMAEPIKSAFQSVGDFVRAVFNGILDFVEGMINGVIGMINKFIGGFNDVVSSAAKFIGKDWTGVPKIPEASIPRLATGAVIPPNREFLAVLGDQKSGTNIEAPTSEIEAAVARGIRNSNLAGSGNMTLVLDGDLAALARVFRPYLLVEGRKVGVSLVTDESIL